MDLQEIRKIVELMNEHGLSLFQFEKEDFNLKLKKGADLEELQTLLQTLPSASPAAPSLPPAASQPQTPAASASEEASSPQNTITSPMVGTFYLKPAPDADPFVKVGDTVSEGQTVCIIEAMKVMNEVKAERSGTISAILVEDSSAVQFGDDLFAL